MLQVTYCTTSQIYFLMPARRMGLRILPRTELIYKISKYTFLTCTTYINPKNSYGNILRSRKMSLTYQEYMRMGVHTLLSHEQVLSMIRNSSLHCSQGERGQPMDLGQRTWKGTEKSSGCTGHQSKPYTMLHIPFSNKQHVNGMGLFYWSLLRKQRIPKGCVAPVKNRQCSATAFKFVKLILSSKKSSCEGCTDLNFAL